MAVAAEDIEPSNLLINNNGPEEDEIYRTVERCVTARQNKVVKRELSESEFFRRENGEVIRPFWSRERLQNEAATLQFIASRTTIPVPDSRLYTKNGVTHLEMTRVTNGVTMNELDRAVTAAAAAAVDEQMQSDILPQLQSFRRSFIGSVDASLPVFPPQRIYYTDRRAWPRIASESDEFVLCHNDLAPQNIFVDPDTFKIVSIIDWEFAGFFPPTFEVPSWKAVDISALHKLYNQSVPNGLAFFGLTKDDLRDCRADGQP